MDILKVLNIDAETLKKIDSEAYKTLETISYLEQLFNNGVLDEASARQYKVLHRDFTNYLKSDDFAKKASSKNVDIKSEKDIDLTNIEIEELDDIEEFDIDGILGIDPENIVVEYDDDIEPVERQEDEIDKEEESVEPDDIEGIDIDGIDIDGIDIDGIDIDSSDEDKDGAEEVIDSSDYGYIWDSDKGSPVKLNQFLDITLAVGSEDNKVYLYSDDRDYFLLPMPKLFAKVIISFPLGVSSSSSISSLLDLFKTFSDEKNKGRISISGSSQEMVDSVLPLFENAPINNKRELTNKELSSEVMDIDNYEDVVNSWFSEGLTSTTFISNRTDIKKEWESYKEFEKGERLPLIGIRYFPYNLSYMNYCYIPAQYLYRKGGNFVQVNSTVYYTPKTKKAYSFYEIGSKLKSNGINTKGFKRLSGKLPKSMFSSEIKAFPIITESSVGTIRNRTTFFYLENGKYTQVTNESIVYFKKYYGRDIEFSYSDGFLLVNQSGKNIGIIPEYNTARPNGGIHSVYDYSEVLSIIRSEDTETFDFFRDITEIIGVDFLGIDSEMPEAMPEPTIEQVKEAEKEIEESNEDEDEAEMIREEIEMLEILLEETGDESNEETDMIKEEIEVLKTLL